MFDSLLDLNRQFSFVEYVIRSSLPIVFAALLCSTLRRQSAAIRHRICLLGLVASLVIPIATCVLPKIAIPLLPNNIEVWSVTGESDLADATTARLIDASRLGRAVGDTTAANGADQPPTSNPAGHAVSAGQVDTLDSSFVLHAEQVVVFCWLTGVAIGAIVFLWGMCRQSIHVRRLPQVNDQQWRSAVAAAAQQMGLKRCPKTVVSNNQCVPSTTGILNPILVVPNDWKTWSSEQRDCILLHELAHIWRRDVASQCLARVTVLVHWFNPLAWHAANKMRLERELASDDCVLQTGHTPSVYAEQLLLTLKQYRPFPVALGVAMASSARLDSRVLAILDPHQRRAPVGRRSSWFATGIVALFCVVAAGVTPFANAIVQANDTQSDPAAATWKESYTVRYEKTLPVSTVFSPDGKRLLTSDSSGELMDLNLNGDNPTYNWKTQVGGSHPAMAFSRDSKTVYATTKDGVRALDAASGEERFRIEEKNSNPIAIDVFPVKSLDDKHSWTQIVFGNAHGYFVKIWATGSPDKAGTISTSTVRDNEETEARLAVPLAVDPLGRSAIMTGPVDGTGQFTGTAGMNVLWAYVCGDYEDGSPGNRIMQGHAETVVSAAWSKDSKVAVTGDNVGRVIEWNAVTMKESHRRELGDRVAAVAISNDGKRAAAYVLGKQGRVLVWDVDKPTVKPTLIHTEFEDLSGPTAFASLDFSPDSDRIAGCVGDRAWLEQNEKDENGEWIGRVRVWEVAASPRTQPTPKLAFSKKTARNSSFVIPNNHSLIRTTSRSDKPGAIDRMRVADGLTQMRIVLGKLPVDRLIASTDKEWLALQQQSEMAEAGKNYDVIIRNATAYPVRATIRDCQKLLDLSKGGATVAVVQDDAVALWNGMTAELIKRAPFKQTRIDAAKFSPDGKLLAISDRHTLVLWQWQENKYERVDLGREVCSLAFSPNGLLLAEGPAADKAIRIRQLETKQIIRTLSNGQPLSVPELTFTQGGRVLIACDRSQGKGPITNRLPRPRLLMWDTLDGSLVHEVSTVGPVSTFKVTPNERYLIAQVESQNGSKLLGWRLDGDEPAQDDEDNQPAAIAPQ